MTYLIDPKWVTDFHRNEDQLELFWMFCCVVAGKNAHTQARLLQQLLELAPSNSSSSFDRFASYGNPLQALIDSRLGQYTRLEKCFSQSVSVLKHQLSTCSVAQLESIHGVGSKTARFFLLHSRPDQKLAVLDTHVLKYLRSQGIDAPKGTPSGTKYAELEQQFLKLAEASGQSVADFDLQIWRKFSGN